MTVRTSSGSGATLGYDKSVYFGFKGADTISVPIQVTNAPVHIIAPDLPEGCLIGVERLYTSVEGKCDPAVPPATVYCEDGCSPLYLFNAEDPDCPDGRRIQNEIWLFETGHYQLVMEGCDPETVMVWGLEDPLVRDMYNCNLPLRGQLCLPDCTVQHVILADGAPSAPPDCLRCEAPVAYDPNTGCTYYWVAPLGSNCQEGEDDGYWEAKCLECPPSDVGLVIPGDGSPTADEVWVCIDDPQNPGEKLIVKKTLALECPPIDETPISIPEDGSPTSEYVWVCIDDPQNPGETLLVRKQLTTPACPCCDQVAVETFAAGGGLCVVMDDIVGDLVWQSRDGVFVEGTGTITTTGEPIGPLAATFTNPFDCPSLLEIDIAAHADFLNKDDTTGDNSVVFVFSDLLAETFPTYLAFRANESMSKAYAVASSPSVESLESSTPGVYENIESIASSIKFIVPALGSKTVYGQWWYVLRNYVGPNTGQVLHGDMRFRATWHKGVIQI